MHQTLADFTGLSLGFELLGDLLQKMGPPLLIDRLGQAHQNGHFVVVQFQRPHGEQLRMGARHDDDIRAATARGRLTADLEGFSLAKFVAGYEFLGKTVLSATEA
jgi:hypothetical protein